MSSKLYHSFWLQKWECSSTGNVKVRDCTKHSLWKILPKMWHVAMVLHWCMNKVSKNSEQFGSWYFTYILIIIKWLHAIILEAFSIIQERIIIFHSMRVLGGHNCWKQVILKTDWVKLMTEWVSFQWMVHWQPCVFPFTVDLWLVVLTNGTFIDYATHHNQICIQGYIYKPLGQEHPNTQDKQVIKYTCHQEGKAYTYSLTLYLTPLANYI